MLTHIRAHARWPRSRDAERPLKAYERVADVAATWELDTANMMMIRPFHEKRALNVVKASRDFIRFDGWVYLEKRGKWTRRYMELKQTGIFHYKDTRVRA